MGFESPKRSIRNEPGLICGRIKVMTKEGGDVVWFKHPVTYLDGLLVLVPPLK